MADSAVGEQETTWDILMCLTPLEQPYPGGDEGGHLVVTGVPVTMNGKERFKVTVPVGYSYEVYANPNIGNLGWAALPFSLAASDKPDRNDLQQRFFLRRVPPARRENRYARSGGRPFGGPGEGHHHARSDLVKTSVTFHLVTTSSLKVALIQHW